MDAASTQLLLHTEVRWLLKGKLLKQVNDLHQELRDFLPERENGI
jgi:hypothetical protein